MLQTIFGQSPQVCPLPSIAGGVFALGSGPGARLPRPWPEGWSLATVNASQASPANSGLVPDITLFGAGVLHRAAENIEAKRAIAGLRTRHLVRVGSTATRGFARKLKWADYRYDALSLLNGDDREQMLAFFLGADVLSLGKPSNGIYLALLCLRLGASEVVMTGFSLSTAGHSYNQSGRLRYHAEFDRTMLLRFKERCLPVSTNDPSFAHESGLTLVEADYATRQIITSA